ncbi:WG repeat-containing protein [Psychrobacter sp. CAL346-MNA-CIBAN-0220]|uniref:WG repeat-containing protein n=1 Tax=Psychrobacter sp. CAL346-MNA-CIBAN-0220 TaxID=3140457 RepID=UPI0033276757
MMLIRFIHSVGNAKTAIALPIVLVGTLVITTGIAQATISCAGYLPSSYFDRIDDNREFAGKLVDLEDRTQQLEDLSGNVIVEGLTDGYILMDKYLWAQRLGANGKKYGIATATGEIIVPFAYDNISTEPDIGTSFIVSIDTPDGVTKQGIIDRNGYWIYPTQPQNNKQQQKQLKKLRIDNGYGDYSNAKPTQQLIKAADAPFNLVSASISHAHYDSDADRDYFLIESLSEDASKTEAKSAINKIGLLDDQGAWVIPQQYDALYPLNPCTGKPLYLQAIITTAKQQQTALIDPYNNIIIPFASNQNIELFNNNAAFDNESATPLFLRSTLIDSSTAIGMTQDIQDDIISAQIVDAQGKLRLSSTAPIIKLLYHQLYAYQQASKFGFIDNQGNIVLKPQFDSYRDEGNKVWVEKQGKMVRLETLTILD